MIDAHFMSMGIDKQHLYGLIIWYRDVARMFLHKIFIVIYTEEQSCHKTLILMSRYVSNF